MNALLNRFLKYVTIDTPAGHDNLQVPSSVEQWDLAKVLEVELKEMGLQNVVLTDHCFVHGHLPSNCGNDVQVTQKIPAIGLMAHMDTYPGFNGIGVKPKVHPCYQGDVLILDEASQCYLSPKEFPDLMRYIGHDIITTDGTSLLGADDKAGIAEIMEAIDFLIKHPEVPHGDLYVVFTPDEETDAGGLSALDRSLFPVDFVVTVDGDGYGEINFENFNAAHAEVLIQGRSVHTGEAKDRMINAIRIASEFANLLPSLECPENTCDHEGFYHIEEMGGNVEEAKIYCLIRDFTYEGFAARKAKLVEIAQILKEKYGENTVQMTLKDDYYNMKNEIDKHPDIIDGILESCKNAGIESKVMPVRGGTDGAILAEMGIPAPNIFLGGHNYHGQYEFASLQAMESAKNLIVEIVQYFAKQK